MNKIGNNNIPNWQSSEVVLAIRGTDGNKRCASCKDTVSVLTQVYTATKLGYQGFQVGQLICLANSRQRVVTSFAPQTGIQLARRQRGSYSRSKKCSWSVLLQRKNDPCLIQICSQCIATNVLSSKKKCYSRLRGLYTPQCNSAQISGLSLKKENKKTKKQKHFSPYTEGANEGALVMHCLSKTTSKHLQKSNSLKLSLFPGDPF